MERLSTTPRQLPQSSSARSLALSLGSLSLILAKIFDNVNHAIPTSRNFSERNQQNTVLFSLDEDILEKPEMRLLLSASSSSMHSVASHIQPETMLQYSNCRTWGNHLCFLHSILVDFYARFPDRTTTCSSSMTQPSAWTWFHIFVLRHCKS